MRRKVSSGLPAAMAGFILVWAICCGGSQDPPTGGDAAGTAAAGPGEGARESASVDIPEGARRRADRRAMLDVLRRYGIDDDEVLTAMAAVPRHEFVPEGDQRHAYDDGPLPIGYGQTISQPYIVAEMTHQLRLGENSKVLEIGTGSGYQAAVLAEITSHVWSIEIIRPLAESAAERLEKLGYTDVTVRNGDGYYGWPEAAPFDAIIVTAAAGHIPPPLIKQLAPGGRMVIPVGGPFSIQTLTLVEKDEEGAVKSRELMAVRFVPLTRAKSGER